MIPVEKDGSGQLNFKCLYVGLHVCLIAYLFTCFFDSDTCEMQSSALQNTVLVQFVPQGTLPSSPFSAVITESNTNKFMSA